MEQGACSRVLERSFSFIRGIVMEDDRFDRPIVVLVGLSMPASLGTLDDVRRFLDDWPPSRRTLFHDRARAVCQTSKAGQTSLEAARRAFVTFARQAGILFVDDVLPPAAILDADAKAA
jgi:hypothetical protein